MTPTDVVTFLESLRLSPMVEKTMQREIEDALVAAGIRHQREVKLGPGDIIDFVIDGIGIECKIKGAKRAIFHQLERYAAYDKIQSIVLLSNVAMGLPDTIKGKPAYFVAVWMAWL